MTRIQVQAGSGLLSSYIRTPEVGLCELIWNAFDEDATLVSISAENDELGGLAEIVVADDGAGMTEMDAQRAFSHVGDSWKMVAGSTSPNGRSVHGKYGRGRYSAFSLGHSVQWRTVAVGPGERFDCVTVTGSRDSLQSFEISDPCRVDGPAGTTVIINGITEAAQDAFDNIAKTRTRILTEFALHLDRYHDFDIRFLGETLDAESLIAERRELPLEVPEGCHGAAKLTVIEWNLEDVDRKIYLCAPAGNVVGDVRAGIQAPGAQFTAYLAWDGFADGMPPILEDDVDSPVGRILVAARTALKAYLGESARRREGETIAKWQQEGVYPYKGEPQSPVEKATRDAFKVVAMAASRTIEESKTRNSKALALRLLKQAFESDPEAILPVLQQVTMLPKARLAELADILERTTLTHLIQAGHKIGGRVDFLNGLNDILFETESRKKLLERKQLHRILANETWLFGEEWSLTGDDDRLSVVLTQHLSLLGEDVDLANSAEILREDGRVAIPDLVLGRQIQTAENKFEHLVVELKRPNHRLKDEDVSQLRSYATAMVNDERFSQPNVKWNFILVGNECSQSVEEARDQNGRAFGLIQESKKYSLWVKLWAEVIGDAEHRLKFVQEALQYESDRDKGLQHLREKYSEYLPTRLKTA
ncbi:ATP-binding protein [Nocardia nova]|uniref:ATP-binding protein n=1 Tax=Nocardia nova TaxID=37330 RepID=UPI0007A3C4B0|nr:ATP-binding protein [Nocardia nova]